IAEQHLDQAEIREVAIERRGRPLTGFLDRVARELERDAAGAADALAHAMRELEMMAIARREVGTGLRDADDRRALPQFRGGEAEVEITLEVERRHAGIVRIIEPQCRAQPAGGGGFPGHMHVRLSNTARRIAASPNSSASNLEQNRCCGVPA